MEDYAEKQLKSVDLLLVAIAPRKDTQLEFFLCRDSLQLPLTSIYVPIWEKNELRMDLLFLF